MENQEVATMLVQGQKRERAEAATWKRITELMEICAGPPLLIPGIPPGYQSEIKYSRPEDK